jgi:hypothetical protein
LNIPISRSSCHRSAASWSRWKSAPWRESWWWWVVKSWVKARESQVWLEEFPHENWRMDVCRSKFFCTNATNRSASWCKNLKDFKGTLVGYHTLGHVENPLVHFHRKAQPKVSADEANGLLWRF